MSDEQQLIFHQRIKLPYRYTTGPMQRAFLRGLEEGRILGARCPSCSRIIVPARPFCPGCSGRLEEVVDLPQTGSLRTWTTVGRDGGSTTYGLIRLDGADSDLLHRIDAEPDILTRGFRLRARFAEERHAEITDIELFVPEDDVPAER